MRFFTIKSTVGVGWFLFLVACTANTIKDGEPNFIPISIVDIADVVPVYEPKTLAGNPSSYNVLGKQYTLLASSKGYVEKGIASWYGTKFHGKKTSNGETYDMYKMTAAHKTLPIPCYVQVTNLQNQRSIVVRINDRGPFHDNRLIDLSYVAAKKLGITQQGTGFVKISTLEPKQNKNLQTSNSVQPPKNLYLQVGAFYEQSNAISLQNHIQMQNLVHKRIATKSHQGLHKVQIGPIYSVQEADDLSKILVKLGIKNSHLITD